MSTALLAELPTEEALRLAIARVRELGYLGALDAFTPYPISGIEEALGLARPRVVATLVSAFVGAGLFGYLLQRWCNVYAYAINVGGRPNEAVPAFVIITFETAVLVTFFVGIGVFFRVARLPMLHQPLLEVEGFERASLDRFWLAVDALHPTFDADRLLRELGALGASRFSTVTQDGVP